jgi:hypothetical protein
VASNPIDRMEKVTLNEKPVEILTVEQAAQPLEAAEVAGGMMTPFMRTACLRAFGREKSRSWTGRTLTSPRRQSRFIRPGPRPAHDASLKSQPISARGAPLLKKAWIRYA